MKMKPIEIFDVVALRADDPDSKMKAGAKGTVLEFLRDGTIAEVEFIDDLGRTLHVGHYPPAALHLVWSYREHQTDREKVAA